MSTDIPDGGIEMPEWNVGRVILRNGDGDVSLWSCPKCGALVQEKHRAGHSRWHASLPVVLRDA